MAHPARLQHRLFAILFLFSLSVSPRADAREWPAPAVRLSTQTDSQMGSLPVFEFHSGFWINLHHFLYQQARARRDSKAAATKPGAEAAPAPAKEGPALSESEQRAWDAAVNYYAANYANRDLLFNSEMSALKNQLGDFENCEDLAGRSRKECDGGLPAPVTNILDRAAPVYRKHWWPAHDRANRHWFAVVAPLIRQKGLDLADRLAQIYAGRWPAEKIRVDLSVYANWAGAYTTLDPLRVTISSTDPRNQGPESLEIVFHEASHGVAGPVQDAIVRECRQRDKPIPRDLWHALLFYTTGEAVKAALRAASPADSDAPVARAANESPGAATAPGIPAAVDTDGKPGYIPYAVREGLYARGWTGYQQLLEKFWQPYLDGRATFDDAIARMVSSL